MRIVADFQSCASSRLRLREPVSGAPCRIALAVTVFADHPPDLAEAFVLEQSHPCMLPIFDAQLLN